VKAINISPKPFWLSLDTKGANGELTASFGIAKHKVAKTMQ